MSKFDEKALVLKLDKILKREFGTDLAFHEFSTGYGIADLVFAPNFSFKKNFIDRTPLTSFNSLKILLTLEENRHYQLSDIIEIFPQFTLQEIKKIFKVLVNNKYLVKISRGIYKKVINRDSLNPIKKIIAIEVKLTDHRNGLIQARRYQYFADESYLAILKEAERNINFSEFNKHNIGLILFDNKSNSIEIKSPKPVNDSYAKEISMYAKEIMLSKSTNLSF